MENIQYKKKIRNKIIVLASTLTLMVVMMLLALSESVCEWLARHLTRSWVYVFGHIGGVVPFSIFEYACLILAVTALAFVTIIIVDLCKKRYAKALNIVMDILVIILLIATIYFSVAGVCYNREKVNIPMAESSVITNSSMSKVGDKFVENFNNSAEKISKNEKGESICPYTFKELSDKIRAEYARLDSDYFGKYVPKAKFVTLSPLMSQFHIAGITFNPTGEANVNRSMPVTDIAQTIAHELAHTLGVMREDDANLVSYYVLITSEDDFLRYCGFRSCYYDMVSGLRYSNNAEQIKKIELEQVFFCDNVREYEYWSKNDLLTNVGEFFNDLYLKLNKQSGTDSYFQNNEGEENGKDEHGNTMFKNVQFTDVQKMLYKLYA